MFDTQIGKQSYVYDLKAEGERLTGKATSDINGENQRTVDIQDDELTGDTVTFVETPCRLEGRSEEFHQIPGEGQVS